MVPRGESQDGSCRGSRTSRMVRRLHCTSASNTFAPVAGRSLTLNLIWLHIANAEASHIVIIKIANSMRNPAPPATPAASAPEEKAKSGSSMANLGWKKSGKQNAMQPLFCLRRNWVAGRCFPTQHVARFPHFCKPFTVCPVYPALQPARQRTHNSVLLFHSIQPSLYIMGPKISQHRSVQHKAPHQHALPSRQPLKLKP